MLIFRRVFQYWVAFILLITAIGKLLDNRGFATVLASYGISPEYLLLPFGLCVSLAELFLALWLITGKKLKLAALCALLMHLVYMLWSAYSVLRGLKLPNCGCFGVFWARPLGWSTVVEDFVMVLFCAGLYSLSPSEKNALR